MSVDARSPEDEGGQIQVEINPGLIRKYIATHRTNKLFEFSYVVCGEPPEVNNIGYFERFSKVEDTHRGLIDAHAIYRGLKRPCIDDGVDSEVYIYVLTPRFTYKYTPDMACAAKRMEAPRDTVFVVYVRFENADYINGVIVGWDWIPCDENDRTLPANFNERYEAEVWTNG